MERLTAGRDRSRTSAVAAPATDWTVRVADGIEQVVITVRDRSVVPLSLVARALVYGLVIGVVGAVVVILLGVAAIRALNIVLEDWQSQLAVGGIFTLAGLFLLSRGRSAVRAAHSRQG